MTSNNCNGLSETTVVAIVKKAQARYEALIGPLKKRIDELENKQDKDSLALVALREDLAQREANLKAEVLEEVKTLLQLQLRIADIHNERMHVCASRSSGSSRRPWAAKYAGAPTTS